MKNRKRLLWGLWIALAMTIYIVFGTRTRIIPMPRWQWNPFRHDDRDIKTQTKLRHLYNGIGMFNSEKGRLPDDMKQLYEFCPGLSEDSERLGFFRDGWGSPIRYVRTKDGVLLYSAGKNRKDESTDPGIGDDIQIYGDARLDGSYNYRWGRLNTADGKLRDTGKE